MGSQTKGTLKFIVFDAETLFKDKTKVKTFVDPYVKVMYGKNEVKSIYGNSFEANDQVKQSGSGKTEYDESKGLHR